ncbi:MAG: lipoprotein signal peptidase [Bacteroidales bacterium]
MKRKGQLAWIIIIAVLIIDQLLKIWVKTHMYLGQEFKITDWFIIHFTENKGMAFGIELGDGDQAKLLLSLFRLVAIGAIGYYLYTLVRRNAPVGLIACISLILAGAIGNMIDSTFYGLIFNESYYQVATMFPPEGGYAGFLHGKVVDMFYFPIIKTTLPAWVPFWGGQEFVFFRPVFNIADSAITVGVIILLIFQKKFFPKD